MEGAIGKRTLLGALIALAALLASPSARGQEAIPEDCETTASNCPEDPNPFVTPPRTPWYFRADAVMLMRDAKGATDVAALVAPNNVVFSTRDLNFQFQGGPRLLIGHTLNPRNQVEFSYFALEHWSDSAAIRDVTPNALGGLGSLRSPFSNFGDPQVSGLDYNDFVSISAKSSLDNGEINFRHIVAMPPGRLSTSYLVGFRYMAMRERFEYDATAAVPLPLGAENFVRTDTANELFGVQLGALFEFYVQDRWWVNFEMKGAIAQNSAEQTTDYRHTDNFGAVTQVFGHQSDRGTAWVGDIALTVAYRWTPCLTTRFGYQAIWVEGLALANENFQRDVNILTLGPAQLDHRGSVVYHGPTIGVELSW